MNEVKVTTNHVPRDILYTYELHHYGINIEELRKEYNWIDPEEWETSEWVIYKGEVYNLQDFMAVDNPFYNPNPPEWLKEWDGYMSQGFIGGLVIKYPRMDYNPEEIDDERVIVGYY